MREFIKFDKDGSKDNARCLARLSLCEGMVLRIHIELAIDANECVSTNWDDKNGSSDAFKLICRLSAPIMRHKLEIVYPRLRVAVFAHLLIVSFARVFMGVVNGPLPPCLSALMVETLASKEVILWLKGHGFLYVRVFSDCSTLCQNLAHNSKEDMSHVGIITFDCKKNLDPFNTCSFNFIPRSANVIAHSLASTAFDQANKLYWDSIPPGFVSISCMLVVEKSVNIRV
ncbi:hypothetical protein DM860_013095 [Cuscuta australis]|uniref:RNase H type-1 domain-containing protein n=1 Tax=Cuscuta australis TaxID=267555 RepID=A0A328DB73_9ASTE|nr:hypothetical protein DM860_013095 [Cuscuta australis]